MYSFFGLQSNRANNYCKLHMAAPIIIILGICAYFSIPHRDFIVSVQDHISLRQVFVTDFLVMMRGTYSQCLEQPTKERLLAVCSDGTPIAALKEVCLNDKLVSPPQRAMITKQLEMDTIIVFHRVLAT